ncbi:MAG TPA: hypothetical protein VK610_06780 [Rhodothermales bacterium]|nr:hypothetical protein [Rhodothermales bacterium]
MPGTTLTVAGDLTVDGIDFTVAPDEAGWDGIRFQDGSTGYLTGGTISGIEATSASSAEFSTAVEVYDATVTLDGTTVTDNHVPGGWAVGAFGSDAELTLTDEAGVEDNEGTGVVADAGGFVSIAAGSIVQQNTEGGVIAMGGGGISVGAVEIINNDGIGVAATTAGIVSLNPGTTSLTGGDPLIALIEGNEGGLIAWDGGEIAGGVCGILGCPDTPNDILGNAPGTDPDDPDFYDAWATTGSVIYAQNNWWGTTNTALLEFRANKSSLLEVEPLATSSASLGGGGGAATAGRSGTGGEGFRSDSLTGVAADVRAAYRALADDEAASAATHLADALQGAADEDERRLAFEAAYRLVSTGALTLPTGTEAWLAAAEGDSLRPWALRALTAVHIGAGRGNAADTTAAALAAAYPETEHAMFAVTLRVRLAVERGDEAGALASLGDLAAAFPSDPSVGRSAALILAAFPGADVEGAVGNASARGGASAPVAEAAVAPSALSLTVAPNPVASSGAVVLTLAGDAAAVRVAVYDAVGREVAVVYDGPLAAGEHRLALAASGLASGVYVVHAAVRPADGAAPAVAVRRVVVAR